MRYIDLQSAYATITTDNGIESEWIVYNADKKKIYELPSGWTEKQVMTAIHLGRKFELIAFNAGADLQKRKVPKTIKDLRSMVVQLAADKDIILNRNILLANELDKLNRELDEITFKNDKK